MFDESSSAGTIIAAVLEGAGFYSHAQILDSFQNFFDAGGALIFILSASLGLLLTVLYGGYRPILALIIGPGLFYFLISYRVPIEPPIKQLGGGDPVDVTQGVKLALNKTDKKGNLTTTLNPAEISWFLSLTARLSSTITRSVTDLILDKEKEEELLFLTQKGALNALLEAEPSRSELQQMLSFTLLNECAPLLSSIYQLSSSEYSSQHEAALVELAKTDASADTSYQQLTYRRGYWDQLFVKYSAAMVKPSQPMRDFMARETSIVANGGQGVDYAAKYGKLYSNNPKKFISDELPQLAFTCGNAMDVFGDAALVQGNWVSQFVEGGTLEQSLQDTPENRELLCQTISKKLFGVPAEVSPCQLGSVAMLFVVRNLFSSTSLNQAAQATINRSITTDTSLSDRCRKDNPDADLDEFCATQDITETSQAWKSINNKNSIQAENLKYSIVSYSLNMPYYQGLMLYGLGAIFPFWALLVLIPGRGASFLYLPLAWFWLKSWDIGFAIVYVLDRLLWNILPSPQLIEDGYTQFGDLPTLLRSVSGVDLGGDLLASYYFVGMSLMAVPLISGYAILKGRSEVLSVIYRAPGIAAQFDKGNFSQIELNESRNIGSIFDQTRFKRSGGSHRRCLVCDECPKDKFYRIA